jgi:hypothetical protein
MLISFPNNTTLYVLYVWFLFSITTCSSIEYKSNIQGVCNCAVFKVEINTLLSRWRQQISVRTFQIYYPIRVISDMRHVHIMLLRIYDLCENRHIKGPTFHVGLNEIMLTRVK